MGVTHRSISSTAGARSDGSAARAACWSGWRARASTPPDSSVRVVSLPATSRVRRNPITSPSSSRRSPDRRGARAPPPVPPRRTPTTARDRPGTRAARPSRRRDPPESPSAVSMVASDHRRSRSPSDPSIPSSSAITAMGMGAAKWSTRSTGSSVGHGVRARSRTTSRMSRLEGSHRPRGEQAVDHRPVRGVNRRVEVQDGEGAQAPAVEGPQGIVDQHAPPGHEPLGVAADVPDLLVAGDGHHPVLRREDRCVAPQPGQDLVVVGSQVEPGDPECELRTVRAPPLPGPARLPRPDH